MDAGEEEDGRRRRRRGLGQEDDDLELEDDMEDVLEHEQEEHDDATALPVTLVRTLREIARNGGYDPNVAVDLQKLRIVWEASGGDLDLAATLYWDDFLANHIQAEAVAGQQQQQPQQQAAVAPQQQQPQQDEDEDEFVEAAEYNAIAAAAEAEHARARAGGLVVLEEPSPVARRLDEEFDRHAHAQAQQQQAVNHHNNNERNRDTRNRAAHRGFPPVQHNRPARPPLPPPNHRQLAEAIAAVEAAARIRVQAAQQLQQQAANRDNNEDNMLVEQQQEASVSVSDDEQAASAGGGGGLALRVRVRQLQGQLQGQGTGNNAETNRASSSSIWRRMKRGIDSISQKRLGGNNKMRLKTEGGGEGKDENKKKKKADAPLEGKEHDEDSVSSESEEEAQEQDSMTQEETLDCFLSDNDWIWDGIERSSNTTTTTTSNNKNSKLVGPPTDILWGLPSSIKNSSTTTTTTSRALAAAAAAAAALGGRGGEESNVIVDDTGLRGVVVGIADAPPAAAVGNGGGGGGGGTINNSNDHSEAISNISVSNISNNNSASTYSKTGIPRTWLSAGFSLSDCGTALCLNPPSEDDLTYTAWQKQHARIIRQSHQQHRRNAVPHPPYHCKCLTAILSIVTATMYTGACPIPGGGASSLSSSLSIPPTSCSKCSAVTTTKSSISSGASKTPFLQLTAEQRKRQFESRLADALSALLWIAVRASQSRKKLALKQLQQSKDPSHQRQWQRLKRRLELVPTCSWEPVDPNSAAANANNNADSDDEDNDNNNSSSRNLLLQHTQVCTSFTHAQDIRCYVLANMKAFTSSGGVALFLETILKIHGKAAVADMIQQQHQKKQRRHSHNHSSNKSNSNVNNNNNAGGCLGVGGASFGGLINCTCEARHAEQQRKARMMMMMNAGSTTGSSNTTSNGNNNMMDTTPPGTECISVELISLLLTGKVHSTWQGWNTGPLEFGILTSIGATGTTTSAGPQQHQKQFEPKTSAISTAVGKGLSRPNQPVWVLRGPTCYSALWMTGCHDNSETFARQDVPGAVAHMTHWNAWYGPNQRQQTKFRLTVGKSKQQQQLQLEPPPEHILPPNKRDPTAMEVDEPLAFHDDSSKVVSKKVRFGPQPYYDDSSKVVCKTVWLLQQRREENARTAKERQGAETVDPDLVFSQQEIEQVAVHPEDQKFYPNKYTMWRYDIGCVTSSEGEEQVADPQDQTSNGDNKNRDNENNNNRKSDGQPLGPPNQNTTTAVATAQKQHATTKRWTAYYRLTEREKLLVETKMGPAITMILLTRWPRTSIVDRFEPQDPPPIV